MAEDTRTSKELRIKLVALSGDELDLVRDEQGHLYVCITDDDRCTSMYLAAAEAAKGRDFLSDAYPAHEPSALRPGLEHAIEVLSKADCYTAHGATGSGLAFADISTEHVQAFRDRMIDKLDEAIGAPSPPPEVGEGEIHPSTREQQEGLLNPVEQVMFRAGLLACRAYMAVFVESGGDKIIADSIRANWWPSLGDDPGPPRKNTFQELTVGEYGEPGFRVKTREEVSPSIEALPVSLGFLIHKCGWSDEKCSALTKRSDDA